VVLAWIEYTIGYMFGFSPTPMSPEFKIFVTEKEALIS
jgi:hypothetical protein